MTHDQHITALFKDAAMRHPDIQHTDGLKFPRFYELEWEEMLQKAIGIACLHWTMVLEEYTEEFRDNNGDWITLLPNIAFMIGKHVPQGKNAEKQTTYREARRIAHSIVAKLRADMSDGCNADLPPGVAAPALVDLNSVKIQKMKLPYFDNAFGVRTTLRIRIDGEKFTRDEVAWLPLP